MQHDQGQNPLGCDYEFNVDYGSRFTTGHPVIIEIRRILDAETRARADAVRGSQSQAPRSALPGVRIAVAGAAAGAF